MMVQNPMLALRGSATHRMPSASARPASRRTGRTGAVQDAGSRHIQGGRPHSAARRPRPAAPGCPPERSRKGISAGGVCAPRPSRAPRPKPNAPRPSWQRRCERHVKNVPGPAVRLRLRECCTSPETRRRRVRRWPARQRTACPRRCPAGTRLRCRCTCPTPRPAAPRCRPGRVR